MSRLATALGLSAGRYGSAAFVGVLDDYTTDMAVAWSVRKRLLTSYTGPLLKIRRDADNTELDIGYTANGLLDEAALEAFCVGGTGSGYIRTIYDQSGNGINIGQATAANQPLLVQSSVMNADGMNFNGIVNFIDTASLAYTNFMADDKVQVLFALTAALSGADAKLFSFNTNAFGAWALYGDTTLYWDCEFPTARINYNPAGFFDVAQTLSLERDGTASRIRVAGTVAHSGVVGGVLSGTDVLRIGCQNGGGGLWKGRITDIVFWKSAASADCAAREAALMS